MFINFFHQQCNQMMLLITLPHAIWQDVLLNWLGIVGEIVRLDLAFCFTRIANPLFAVYDSRAFSFPHCMRLNNTHGAAILTALYFWMQKRKVYVSRVVLTGGRDCLSSQWENFFAWSAETLQSLAYTYPFYDESGILFGVVSKLKRLQRLYFDGERLAGPEFLDRILENNSSTLETALFNTLDHGPYCWGRDGTVFHRLQVLFVYGWEQGCLAELLGGCPNLTALSIRCCSAELGSHCSLLRSLCCVDAYVSVPTLAVDCPLLEYLELRQNFAEDATELVDVVTALLHLHTLIVNELPESAVLEIATRGHPSLRIVDTITMYTYAGLRQVTAAHPQLTKLAIYSVSYESAVHWNLLLQHGGNLEALKLSLYVAKGANCADAIFDSAVTHCPHLRTLIISDRIEYRGPKLANLLMHCPLLRTLRVKSPGEVTVPPDRPSLVVTDEEVELAVW